MVTVRVYPYIDIRRYSRNNRYIDKLQ
jgi:hypothetical protein